jgi:hypothetical protein
VRYHTILWNWDCPMCQTAEVRKDHDQLPMLPCHCWRICPGPTMHSSMTCERSQVFLAFLGAIIWVRLKIGLYPQFGGIPPKCLRGNWFTTEFGGTPYSQQTHIVTLPLWDSLHKHVDTTYKTVRPNPDVRPCPNNTPNQCHILVTWGKTKTLAIRSNIWL